MKSDVVLLEQGSVSSTARHNTAIIMKIFIICTCEHKNACMFIHKSILF